MLGQEGLPNTIARRLQAQRGAWRDNVVPEIRAGLVRTAQIGRHNDSHGRRFSAPAQTGGGEWCPEACASWQGGDPRASGG